MIQIFDDLEQGSAAWFQIRAGIPTASNFSAVLAKGEGKTRRSYMCRLAAEIVTGEPGETFTTAAMDRGKVMEAEARQLYEFVHDAPLRQVGFVLNDGVGWSPDSLIGDNGGVEIKSQRADLLVETLLKDEFPPEHKAQVQGGLWVGERDWIDLVVYWPKMPLFVKRVGRDEPYIANLKSEVTRFRDDLIGLVAKIKNYGMARAA